MKQIFVFWQHHAMQIVFCKFVQNIVNVFWKFFSVAEYLNLYLILFPDYIVLANVNASLYFYHQSFVEYLDCLVFDYLRGKKTKRDRLRDAAKETGNTPTSWFFPNAQNTQYNR